MWASHVHPRRRSLLVSLPTFVADVIAQFRNHVIEVPLPAVEQRARPRGVAGGRGERCGLRAPRNVSTSQ